MPAFSLNLGVARQVIDKRVVLRRDFAVDDEAMPLVLGLLDQVYSLRRHLRRLCDAVAAQPPEVQEAVRRALAASDGGQR